MKEKPTIITLTGATCSGKTTVMRYLISRHGFTEVLSFTTRQPRFGEVYDKDYRFVGEQEARRYIESGQAVEHVSQGGVLYGILKEDFDRALNTGFAAVIVNPDGLRPIAALAAERGAELVSYALNAPAPALMRRLVARAVADGPPGLNRHLDRVNRIFREELFWVDEVFKMPELKDVIEISSGDDISPGEIAEMIAHNAGATPRTDAMGENLIAS